MTWNTGSIPTNDRVIVMYYNDYSHEYRVVTGKMKSYQGLLTFETDHNTTIPVENIIGWCYFNEVKEALTKNE